MAMAEAQEKKNYIRHRLRTDTLFCSILFSRELQIHIAKDMDTGRPEEFRANAAIYHSRGKKQDKTKQKFCFILSKLIFLNIDS